MSSRDGMQPDLFYGETMYHSSYDHLSPNFEHAPPNSSLPSMCPEREREDPPVLELRVPMCCEKCAQKVKEGLDELEGVCKLQCDLFHQRVTITGFVDANSALAVVKRVKKKSEYFQQGSYIIERNSLDPHHASLSDAHCSGTRMVFAQSDCGHGLMCLNSFGRRLDPSASFSQSSPVLTCGDHYEPGASFRGVRDAECISLNDECPLIYGDSNHRSSSCRFSTFRCLMCVRECPNVLGHYR